MGEGGETEKNTNTDTTTITDTSSLDKLVEEYTQIETALVKRETELAERNQEFAQYIEAQKDAKREYEALRVAIKEEMENLGITSHDAGAVSLKLTPSGKYKADDISAVADEVCVIKKTLDNKKVKAYLDLNGELPEGVQSLGNVLRITVKE